MTMASDADHKEEPRVHQEATKGPTTASHAIQSITLRRWQVLSEDDAVRFRIRTVLA